MSGNVKGCKTPAPNRRPVSARKYSTGRRLTSLDGGNRGTTPRGHGRQMRYGDLSGDFSVRGGKVTRHRDATVHCRVSCIPIAPVFLRPVSAKECISMPSAKRWPDRVGPIKVRQAAGGGDYHDSAIHLGGARGRCPRRKISMTRIGAPQSGQT